MRSFLIAAVIVLSTGAAYAESSPTAPPRCISVAQGYSRIAAMVANPADCCTGRMECAQFLSTTTVVRPAHHQRT